MRYESPKTLRNRQQRQNDAPKKRTARQPQPLKTFADADWKRTCEYHVKRIFQEILYERAETAGRHAEALAHMAVMRRALQIARLERKDYYAALDAAKAELYDVEAA